MSAYIAAPDARRLLNVLLWNRPTLPSPAVPLFARRWPRVSATVFVALFTAFIVAFNVSGDLATYHAADRAANASPLYGIYDVEDSRREDAAITSPLAHATQWRRVVFDAGGRVTIRTESDVVTKFSSKLDVMKHSITLTDRAVPGHTFVLGYERPGFHQLVLRGSIAGEATVVRLRRFDEKQYLLLSRGFNWIQERPFNR